MNKKRIIGFTCSCFDLMHAGHVLMLKDAKRQCDYLIVGAGYTGLSAARQLALNFNSSKIVVVDSQLAGEGSSARNSGYLVDIYSGFGIGFQTRFSTVQKYD